MNEPVLIGSGFTYEKTEILKHFQINGSFDPMNRIRVDKESLTSNYCIKHATEEFIM